MSKHWAWGYFFTNGLLFRSNNSYKNAWCIACLNHHKELLWQSDVLGAAIRGTSGGIQNLEKEMEAYELLSSAGEENTDEVPETPAIPA